VGDATTAVRARATGMPGRVVAEVRAAVALLTRLPMRTAGVDATGAPAFALVGAGIGVLGAVPFVALGPSEPLLASVAAIAVMALASGALHLDGLADTADALLATDGARAEQARKDPAIGPGGAVALVLVLAAQVAALSSLTAAGPVLGAAACVVAGTVSRAVPVVLSRLVTSRRPRAGGLGGWFIDRVGTLDAVAAVVTGVAVVALAAVVAGSAIPAVGAGAGLVAGLLAGTAIAAGRGQLDGDGLGASVELTLAATLAACAIATP
jgi:adenosylcobinamide-GDP ribazoletransferase